MVFGSKGLSSYAGRFAGRFIPSGSVGIWSLCIHIWLQNFTVFNLLLMMFRLLIWIYKGPWWRYILFMSDDYDRLYGFLEGWSILHFSIRLLYFRHPKGSMCFTASRKRSVLSRGSIFSSNGLGKITQALSKFRRKAGHKACYFGSDICPSMCQNQHQEIFFRNYSSSLSG